MIIIGWSVAIRKSLYLNSIGKGAKVNSEEIRHRLEKDSSRVQGLSDRTIQAIRASPDAGLVHESHGFYDGLVDHAIGIARGP